MEKVLILRDGSCILEHPLIMTFHFLETLGTALRFTVKVLCGARERQDPGTGTILKITDQGHLLYSDSTIYTN